MELLLLAMVCISPWYFGAVGETAELLLLSGVACLTAAAAVRMLLQRQRLAKRCPVIFSLAGLFLLGVWQLTPLPPAVLERLSPATADLYDQLLPQQRERLETSAPPPPRASAAGTTISLYPQATRSFLIRLLALLLLLAIVRTQIASPASLRRLAVATAINATALALFGIVQFFSSSDRSLIYWQYESAGTAFGPFVNRNHFAFYINIAIGLTLGLLLARNAGDDRRYLRSHAWQRLLQDPVALWLALALALMLSSVVFCLSRGGVVALLGATATAVAALAARQGRGWSTGGLLLAIAGAAGLLVWFGLEPIEARLVTLWHADTYAAGRGYLLAHAHEMVARFPLWGTGYGTFQYVEPLYLHTSGDVGTIYQHAHNDYLEDLVEGGAIRLALRLIVAGLLVRFAWRATRAAASPALAGLAAGSLFAVTTVIIHSFVEFGLFVPAIAVLAATLAGQIAALGDVATAGQLDPRTAERPEVPAQRPSFAAWLMLPAAVAVGWLLVGEGRRAVAVDDLRRLARQARADALAGSASRGNEIAPLLEAVQLRPADAVLRSMFADALLETYAERLQVEQPTGDRAAALREHLLLAGLEEARAARDLGPLLPAPHARLAYYQAEFAAADPRQAYLDRIKLLAPADPQLWYFCGLQEAADGRLQQACHSWRRSLQLSDRYLLRILQAAAGHLAPDQIAHRVLPAQPELLLAAADALFPADQSQQRAWLLQMLLRCFDDPHRSFTPVQLHAKAIAHRQLGQPEQAIAAYRAALAGQAQQPSSWRYELAELYYQQGQYQASRRELDVVLVRDPRHAAARKLRDQAARHATEQRLQDLESRAAERL